MATDTNLPPQERPRLFGRRGDHRTLSCCKSVEVRASPFCTYLYLTPCAPQSLCPENRTPRTRKMTRMTQFHRPTLTETAVRVDPRDSREYAGNQQASPLFDICHHPEKYSNVRYFDHEMVVVDDANDKVNPFPYQEKGGDSLANTAYFSVPRSCYSHASEHINQRNRHLDDQAHPFAISISRPVPDRDGPYDASGSRKDSDVYDRLPYNTQPIPSSLPCHGLVAQHGQDVPSQTLESSLLQHVHFSGQGD